MKNPPAVLNKQSYRHHQISTHAKFHAQIGWNKGYAVCAKFKVWTSPSKWQNVHREIRTFETLHSQNQPGSRIDNIQTVITNTEPTNQPSID